MQLYKSSSAVRSTFHSRRKGSLEAFDLRIYRKIKKALGNAHQPLGVCDLMRLESAIGLPCDLGKVGCPMILCITVFHRLELTRPGGFLLITQRIQACAQTEDLS